MDENRLFRVAGWAAYVSGGISILALIMLILFFSVGEPFGYLSDFTGGVVFRLSMLPLALLMHRLVRPQYRGISLLAFIVGVLSMLANVISATLVILKGLGTVNFPEPIPGGGPYGLTLYAQFGIGTWLVAAGILVLVSRKLPPLLAWIGILAGLGLIVGSIGILLGVTLAAAAFLLAAIGYPIWAIWLGRWLLRSRSSQPSFGSTQSKESLA